MREIGFLWLSARMDTHMHGGYNGYKDAYAPVLVEFNLSRVISAARFDTSPGTI